MTDALLSVRNLRVEFPTRRDVLTAIDDGSFDIMPGEVLGLMGSIPMLTQTDARLVQIPGAMPRLNAIPPGCAFHPRCPLAMDRCKVDAPHQVAAETGYAAYFALAADAKAH